MNPFILYYFHKKKNVMYIVLLCIHIHFFFSNLMHTYTELLLYQVYYSIQLVVQPKVFLIWYVQILCLTTNWKGFWLVEFWEWNLPLQLSHCSPMHLGFPFLYNRTFLLLVKLTKLATSIKYWILIVDGWICLYNYLSIMYLYYLE